MSESVMELRDFLNDPDIKNYKSNEQMEREQELEDTRELSLKQGIEQGKISKAISIARNMVIKGYNLEEIKDITKLSIKEIQKLRNS